MGSSFQRFGPPRMMDGGKGTTINPEMLKAEHVDNISKLPDLIPTDILSRLNAKEVIQTCTLSKRWSKLWAFVPCLEFRYSKFKGKEETQENKERELERFENFVTSCLRLRDDATDLHSFTLLHLRYDNEARLSGSAVMTWLLYALKHNPNKLKINLHVHDCIQVPDCLFACDSLEDVYLNMEMDEGKVEIKPDFVHLPRLKTIYFRHVSLNGDYMEKLLSGCLALESLTLTSCDMKMSNISFRTLQSLSIGACKFKSEMTPLYISTPALKYLFFIAKCADPVKLKDMPKVTKAIVSAQIVLSEDRFVANHSCELLSCLSNVEDLELLGCHFLKEMLKRELPKCPTFVNVKKLSLGVGCMYCNLGLMCSLLKRCPNLEVLGLSHREEKCQDKHGQEELGQDLDQIEKLGCNRLREIEIVYTKYDRDVDRVVKLLRSKLEMKEVRIFSSQK